MSGTEPGWFTSLDIRHKVVFVILWPISVPYGLYWMWKDERFSENARIVLTAVAVFLFLVVGLAIRLRNASDQVPTVSPDQLASQAAVTAPEPPAAPAPEPPPAPDYAHAPLTVAGVTAALRDAGMEPGSVGLKQGAVTVSKNPTVWDENDMVKGTGRDALSAFEVLFRNPGVKEATYVSTASMTDQYGKSSAEPVVKLTYSRATATKIDWKGLKDRAWADWKAPFNIATYYYIHPGVWKNLKERIPVEGGTGS